MELKEGHNKMEESGRVKLKDVFFFRDGNVFAGDYQGEQVRECQGFILDIAEKLIEHSDENTKFHYCGTRGSNGIQCDFSWWFKKRRLIIGI